jgi:hypothetical protein
LKYFFFADVLKIFPIFLSSSVYQGFLFLCGLFYLYSILYLFWDMFFLCSPGCPGTQRSICLCILSTGIKDICNYQCNSVYMILCWSHWTMWYRIIFRVVNMNIFNFFSTSAVNFVKTFCWSCFSFFINIQMCRFMSEFSILFQWLVRLGFFFVVVVCLFNCFCWFACCYFVIIPCCSHFYSSIVQFEIMEGHPSCSCLDIQDSFSYPGCCVFLYEAGHCHLRLCEELVDVLMWNSVNWFWQHGHFYWFDWINPWALKVFPSSYIFLNFFISLKSSLKWKFLVSLETRLCLVIFFSRKCFLRRCFCWSRQIENVLLRKDRVFLGAARTKWIYWRKHVLVGKGIIITLQPMSDAVWCWYSVPFFSGHHCTLLTLVIICCKFI